MSRAAAPFPFEARAAATEAARLAANAAAKGRKNRDDPTDPTTIAWRGAVEAFGKAIDAAYPPGFWDDVAKLRRDDWSGLESAIRFLEADPFFFRSGYVKARLLRLVKRAPLKPAEADRLRGVVLAAIDGRDRREFRSFCRLASRLDSRELRDAVEARILSSQEGVRRRARWTLDSLRRAAGQGV